MMKKYDWLAKMIQTNIKAATADKSTAYVMAAVMTVNNLIWFIVWVIFFNIAGEINGWKLHDVARMFGIVAFSFGIAFVSFGGAWRMARLIVDGHLDTHLARPKSPLVSLIFGRAEPEAVGDVLSGIILILFLGDMSLAGNIGALLLGLIVAVILASTAIIVNSLVFWSGGRTSIVDQIFDVFINLSTMPQHGLPTIIKVLLFTALPAGFVAFLPVDLLREFSILKLAAMGAAAMVFPVLAIFVFNRGLRHYTSGNKMLEVR